MRLILISLAIFSLGCSSAIQVEPSLNLDHHPIAPKPSSSSYEVDIGQFVNWGYYQLEIRQDGSYGDIIPLRNAEYDYYYYGHHMNVLKFLEGGQCTNCVSVGNIHPTPEGYVSVDVSITHPFKDPRYTGFDVRGIIMFPASQQFPDSELRALVGWEPYEGDIKLYSSSKKGDTELVNGEGWTRLWAPGVDMTDYGMTTEMGFPIYGYWEGKFASGENIGTLNPFIRFYSNENRHMFEVGKTVTRTYIIKPPAEGPIEACYAVYAHWNEPDVVPVTDPASDFPLDANSCLAYELDFYQDGIIDPDAPPQVQAEHIHIYMKHWDVIPLEDEDGEYWDLAISDLIDPNMSVEFEPHPSGLPDEYWSTWLNPTGYNMLPDYFYPGTWPVIFKVNIKDYKSPFGIGVVGCEFWIMDVEFGAKDGEW